MTLDTIAAVILQEQCKSSITTNYLIVQFVAQIKKRAENECACATCPLPAVIHLGT